MFRPDFESFKPLKGEHFECVNRWQGSSRGAKNVLVVVSRFSVMMFVSQRVKPDYKAKLKKTGQTPSLRELAELLESQYDALLRFDNLPGRRGDL